MKVTFHGELNTKVLAKEIWKMYLEDKAKGKLKLSRETNKDIEKG